MTPAQNAVHYWLTRLFRSNRERLLLERVRELEAQNERQRLYLREIRRIALPWVPSDAPTHDLAHIEKITAEALKADFERAWERTNHD